MYRFSRQLYQAFILSNSSDVVEKFKKLSEEDFKKHNKLKPTKDTKIIFSCRAGRYENTNVFKNGRDTNSTTISFRITRNL
ncbi:PREDICTED: uncharacterized protein LOC105621830 [Atta cephalotes]|uniref:Uncharacterized protein n=1 Tax=Atta cephalotes TaxID=12957 RepID=A0A158NMA5_ATTCE|nr:PREDICTED: uncharacterized protein LOC105621830 [Atta cephalotes]